MLALASICLPSLAADKLELIDLANVAHAKREYKQSAAYYLDAFKLAPENWSLPYNAACDFALLGDVDSAFKYLAMAVSAAPGLGAEQLRQDEDLISLRQDPRWSALLARAQAAFEKHLRMANSLTFPLNISGIVAENDRIAGLFKLCSEVKFNFESPVRLKDIDWDAVCYSYLPKVRNAESTTEYYLLLAELVAKLEHNGSLVTVPDETHDLVLASPAFRTHFIEGRIIVTKVFDKTLEAQGLVAGVEVLAADGVNAVEYARLAYAKHHGSDTTQHRDAAAGGKYFLQGPVGVPVQIRIANAVGKQSTLSVSRYPASSDFIPPTPIMVRHKLDSEEIGLISFTAFTSQYFKNMFADFSLAKSRALILDLREYSPEHNLDDMAAILTTLIQKPFQLPPQEWRAYYANARFFDKRATVVQEGMSLAPSPAYRYTRPIYILTSGMTSGPAEQFIATLVGANRATVIGEPTAGNNSQWILVDLPAGGSGKIAAMRPIYPGNVPRVGQAIAPHVAVTPTVADVRAGIDTVLVAAMARARRDLTH